MAHIVVLGAGIGGIPAAFELREKFGKKHSITLVSNLPYFQFTPSNPWVGLGWRTKKDITIELAPLMKRMGLGFEDHGATALRPADNAIDLSDGREITYDYLIIATGPELAFDEVPGLGPHEGYTQSVCTVEHATHAREMWSEFCKDPGPIIVGAVQGASCYGPAYEFAGMMDTDLKKRKIRDQVPMTFVTPEPYIGHLGLGGVGDTKGLLEAEFRDRHIKWITNAKVDRIEAGTMFITEHNDDGSVKQGHELPFKYSMMLPAFRGVPATRGHEGLTNPRGFVIVDKHHRNTTFTNIFGIGVCIAIAPLEATAVPVGVPKTGFMIESMVTASVENIAALLEGREPQAEATWNALCLADFGDKGAAFIAQPQNPPRNLNWAGEGKWVHLAKIAFERYFIRKIRKGQTVPFYENIVLTHMLKLARLKRK